MVAAGVDPSEQRKAESGKVKAVKEAKLRADNGKTEPDSFDAVFRDWLDTRRSGWSETYAAEVEARIVNDVLPWLGKKPIASVDERMLLECLRRVKQRGAIESAHSTMQNCGQVFRFAIASGLANRNPAQGMTEALKPVIITHMAAIVEPERFGELLRSIDEYRGSVVTRSALLLAALTFQRPANVREMEWTELDLDAEKPLWTIPSAKVKRTVQKKASGRPHLVPLAPQAVIILRAMLPITGEGRYVFRSLHTSQRPISENTMNVALRRLGFTKDEMTSHGFRSSARTMLVERPSANAEVVEVQLAHGKSGPLGGAYDRAEHMAQRYAQMQQWADYIDALREGKSKVDSKLAKPPMKRSAKNSRSTV